MAQEREVGVTVRADTSGFRADVESLDRNVLQPRERRLQQLQRRVADQQKRIELLQAGARQLGTAIRSQAVTTGSTIAFSQVAAGLGLDQSLIGRLGTGLVTGAIAGAGGGPLGAGIGAAVAGLTVLTGEAISRITSAIKRADDLEEKLEVIRKDANRRFREMQEQQEALAQRIAAVSQQQRDELEAKLEEINYRTALVVPALQLR